jgi:hypothetical protein
MFSKIKKYFNRQYLFYFSVIALVLQRILHFKNTIEEPMAWRQYDTEFFAYAFFRDGINILKPSVCWLASHKTLILEFPLISAIIAVLYKLFGHSVIYARLVIFIFFLASAFYFYLLIKHLYYERLAKFSLLIYLLIPLSIFYSIAINIDFPVLFFSVAALYYYILAYEKEKYTLIILASLFSLIAFLIKAPYVFYIYIPLLYIIIKRKQINFFLKTLPIIVIPLIIFLIWQRYAVDVNNNAPDWFFIPDYFKFNSDMTLWYFGSLKDRLNFEFWKQLLTRMTGDEITYIGLPFFFIGLFSKPLQSKYKSFFTYYFAGIIIYLLLFFTLNVIHDYYQAPIIVVFSYFIAKGIDIVYRNLKERSLRYANAVIGFLLFVLMVNGIWYTERWYYKPDKIRNSTAEYINKNTPDNSLIVASIDLTDPRDPSILAPAYRYGWSIRTGDLNKTLLDSLFNNGAQYLSITINKELDSGLSAYLQHYNKQEVDLSIRGWKLLFYKLK